VLIRTLVRGDDHGGLTATAVATCPLSGDERT
jgi:hypothetical protein